MFLLKRTRIILVNLTSMLFEFTSILIHSIRISCRCDINYLISVCVTLFAWLLQARHGRPPPGADGGRHRQARAPPGGEAGPPGNAGGPALPGTKLDMWIGGTNWALLL